MLAGALILLASAVRPGAQTILLVTHTGNNGPGSLRQALADADPAGGSIIRFPGVKGSMYGGFTIDRPVTIEGPGADQLAIVGLSRAFNVTTNVTNVVISGLSLINGTGSSGLSGLGGGGGLRVLTDASVAVYDCIFSGNTTDVNPTPIQPDGWASWLRSGGAIFNTGNLRLFRCTIMNNTTGTPFRSGLDGNAGGDGAGIYNMGQLYMEACNVSHNQCGQGETGNGGWCYGGDNGPGGRGGGLFNAGRAVIVDSTFSHNSAGRGGHGCEGDNLTPFGGSGGAGGSGGGIFSSGELVISNCVFSSNRSGAGGNGAAGGRAALATLRGGQGGRAGHAGHGGAIHNSGTLLVVGTTLAANVASSGGSGGRGGNAFRLYPEDPPGKGGHGGNGGDSGHGGGIYNEGPMTIIDTTLVGNTATVGGERGAGGQVDALPGAEPGTPGEAGANGEGAGIYTSTPASLQSSFLAANDAVGSSRDVAGPFTSQGDNLVENTTGSTGFDERDVQGLDPDLDGLSNFMEFALGTDPRLATVTGRPGGSIQSVGGTNYATLTFTRARKATAAALRYEIKVADSLNTNSWQSGSIYQGTTRQHFRTTEISRQTNGAVEVIVVRDLIPALSRSTRFLRLDVSIP